MYILMDRTNFSKWLQQKISELQISQSELARRSRLSRQAISKYLNEERMTPNKEALLALSRGLKISPEIVFRAAGILPEMKGEDPTQEQWNYIYTQLDQNKREQLLQYAHYLAEEQAKYETRSERTHLAKDLPPAKP